MSIIEKKEGNINVFSENLRNVIEFPIISYKPILSACCAMFKRDSSPQDLYTITLIVGSIDCLIQMTGVREICSQPNNTNNGKII